jgi:hypothetical protein
VTIYSEMVVTTAAGLGADLNRFICRSRRRVGWCEFSALLFSLLCWRCSRPGMTSLFAQSLRFQLNQREEDRFAPDSSLEGDGFEPSVPRKLPTAGTALRALVPPSRAGPETDNKPCGFVGLAALLSLQIRARFWSIWPRPAVDCGVARLTS